MAGGKNSRDEKTSEAEAPAGEERWARSRRDDLANTIGVIVVPPFHGEDASGKIKFGIRPVGGYWDDETVARYVAETQFTIIAIKETIAGLKEELGWSEALVKGEPYSVGPAAQEWPKFLYLLYEHGRPILENAVLMYSAGQMVKTIVRSIRHHDDQISKDPDRSVDRFRDSDLPEASTEAVAAELLLTPGALVSLCIMDAYDRYDIRDGIDVEIHTRSHSDYSTQGHPGFGGDIHSVRIRKNGNSLYWVVQTSGAVVEHFSLKNQVLAQLPLPNWFEEDSSRTDSFRTDRQHFQLRLDLDA